MAYRNDLEAAQRPVQDLEGQVHDLEHLFVAGFPLVARACGASGGESSTVAASLANGGRLSIPATGNACALSGP